MHIEQRCHKVSGKTRMLLLMKKNIGPSEFKEWFDFSSLLKGKKDATVKTMWILSVETNLKKHILTSGQKVQSMVMAFTTTLTIDMIYTIMIWIFMRLSTKPFLVWMILSIVVAVRMEFWELSKWIVRTVVVFQEIVSMKMSIVNTGQTLVNAKLILATCLNTARKAVVSVKPN